ncbi:hypothetical protein ACPEIF_26290 [Streptomyces sp. NPDC012600]|uniref:Translation elongation factor EFG/EF2 domain-containing protein n=1 Tax=Streptomyces stephensoniae TaxID=3375367 RepID=A0ABU2WE17_9ACTN|nr:hypothetical protein [Streptomyces griseus]MDT0495327.1 hypothetical protein [Streptomyces griseus]
MTTRPPAFPPRPLRGVRATYARQTSCPSDFARVVVDFEPWEPGLAFEVDDRAARVPGWSAQDVAELCEALRTGIHEELAALGPGTTVAAAVVVRELTVHEVDSSPRSFRAAGRLAVRNALAQV